MDYEKIILDLLNRIVTLEKKVVELEKSISSARSDTAEIPTGSKKYRFLSDYLHQSNSNKVELSFLEIEDILKFKLPDSAITHRTFWANTTSHSIALSWLSVNYLVTEVNLEDKYIIFEKKRGSEKMTLDEQMQKIVYELVSEYGTHYEISLQDLYQLLGSRFGTNYGSIIPSDYCYNRVNKGVEFDRKPRLFKFLGDGMYECLGEKYPYSGPVEAKPIGEKNTIVVGSWTNGNLTKNENWELYCMK